MTDDTAEQREPRPEAALEMGWGKLIFAHTFADDDRLIEAICDEGPGRRHIGFYLQDPHVLLAKAPDRLFLDPSHTFRLWAHAHAPSSDLGPFAIRRVASRADAEAVDRIFAAQGMVPCGVDFLLERADDPARCCWVAASERDDTVLGTATGVDHAEAFRDPAGGASLWCLAVDPQCQVPGVGRGLLEHALSHFFRRGRAYVDLSVIHDNEQAIGLYEKMGFRRVAFFCVKHRNAINEPLYTPPLPEEALNPYARIIVDEARRRGIAVRDVDAEGGYFTLGLGGRAICCRESLTELTTAVAMSICDDKAKTRRVLEGAGLRVPEQRRADGSRNDKALLEEHGAVVVKPARGEQGRGVSPDVRDADRLRAAVEEARAEDETVLLERRAAGVDLRVIVIHFRIVAAAERHPPVVTGTGRHAVRDLIEKYNRRRAAATDGESAVPLDAETEACVAAGGHGLDDVLPEGERLVVRRAANLHTGGTIHDTTDRLHPALAEAAVTAASAIDVPVAGVDMIVDDSAEPGYAMIEVNERPGLAHHEPQPTAERFVDLLFPETAGAGPEAAS